MPIWSDEDCLHLRDVNDVYKSWETLGQLIILQLRPDSDRVPKVVPRESVIMGTPNEISVALDADHVHMTKFDDSTNEVYRLIVGLLREVRGIEPKRLAEAGEAINFRRRDDLILKSLELFKDNEHLTVDPKGM